MSCLTSKRVSFTATTKEVSITFHLDLPCRDCFLQHAVAKLADRHCKSQRGRTVDAQQKAKGISIKLSYVPGILKLFEAELSGSAAN